MQLFGRCGALGIVTIDANATDSVGCIKEQLCQRYPELGEPSELAVYYRGRAWHNGTMLSRAHMREGSTLDVQGRLRGGGGDGGSTGAESRSSYLEMYKTKKADKVNPAEEKLAKWTTCHLSGEPLCPPVVCDELGSLFNKDAVVRALVAKSLPKPLHHITGLKSLLTLKLERNPNQKAAAAAGAAAAAAAAANGSSGAAAAAAANGANGGSVRSAADFQPGNEAEYVCPVSGVPMNGRFRFVALRPSGLVVSEKALKEVKAAVLEMVGGSQWAPEDVQLLNPEGEALDNLRQAALLKLAAAKAKKAAKRAAKDAAATNGATNGVAAAAAENGTNGAANGAANGGDAAAAVAAGLPPKAKKAKGNGGLPDGSDVYRSLFIDKSKQSTETYLCRGVTPRR